MRMADSIVTTGAFSEDSESFNPITTEDLEGGDAYGDYESARVQKCKLDLLTAVAGMDRGAAAGAVQRKVMSFDVCEGQIVHTFVYYC